MLEQNSFFENTQLKADVNIDSNESMSYKKSFKSILQKSKTITKHKLTFQSDDTTVSESELSFKNKIITKKDFQILSLLGKGAFAKVNLVSYNDKYFALKILDKQFMSSIEKTHEAHIEKYFLSNLHHEFIVKLHTTFHDQKNLYFLLDYCPNKTLSDLLRHQSKLSDSFSQYLTAQLVEVLDYFRKKGITHRDLKPENVLLDSNMRIKLCDFSTCIIKDHVFDKKEKRFVIKEDYFKDDSKAEDIFSLVGTAEYISPESVRTKKIIENDDELNYAIDLWSLGCIVYKLFEGESPFGQEAFTNPDCDFKLKFSNSTPKVASDLIRALLVKDPKERIGFKCMSELKEHYFFEGIDFENISFLDAPLTDPIVQMMMKRSETGRHNTVNHNRQRKNQSLYFSSKELINKENVIAEESEDKENAAQKDEGCIAKRSNLRSVTSKVKSSINVCHYLNDVNNVNNEEGVDNASSSNKVKRIGSLFRMMNDDTVIIEGKSIIYIAYIYIYKGLTLKKSPWLHYNKRLLKLYVSGKLEYYDTIESKLKGTITLTKDSTAVEQSDGYFELHSPNRKFKFQMVGNNRNESAKVWVNSINKVIKGIKK